MTERAKFAGDWFPVYFHRLLASKRWQQMNDFQRGWYWSLLLHAADSERAGYLPNDDSVLWRLAGARTKAYFQREGQSVLQCFDGRTEDGAWIYNPTLLEVLGAQSLKLSRRGISPTPLSVSLDTGFYRSGETSTNGEELFLEFKAAHPRATGSCAESTAFFEASGGNETEAQRIIEAAKLYREAHESGEMGHAPARAANWLRDQVFNESPEFWRKGAGDARSERNRRAIQSAVAEVADGKD